MAVIDWQAVATPHDGRNLKLIKWEGLTASDTGRPFNVGAYTDKSVQVLGTFGGTVTIQGTLDPDAAVWATLTDPQGNALTPTSATIENILEHCYQLRPSAGAGVSDVDVWLLLASMR